MREAQVKLAEVRKDRGYKGPGSSASQGVAGKGSGRASIAAKKASGKHICFDCGQSGHWSGDAECKKPGAGLARPKNKAAKQVRITEAAPVANEVAEIEAASPQVAHEVMMIMMSIAEALQSSSCSSAGVTGSETLASSTLAVDRALVGALDSACNRTCAGDEWIQGYLQELDRAPQHIRDLILVCPEKENFKFGNGGVLPSATRYRLPAVVSGNLVLIWVSSGPVSSLGLLLGRDFLDGLGGVLDFGARTLVCKLFGETPTELKRLAAGHSAALVVLSGLLSF